MSTSPARLGTGRLRVLVVDDAVTYRQVLSKTLGTLEAVEVAAVAGSIGAAQRKIAKGGIDAVTIDVNLASESGLDLLTWVRAHHPLLMTILVTSGSQTGARTEVDAMFLGATALILKPTGEDAPRRLAAELGRVLRRHPERSARVELAPMPAPMAPAEREVIVVGASTGGPPVVERFLKDLPRDFATPVLLVQHMPAYHVPFFAALLAERCQRPVTVAQHGEWVQPGRILVAGEAKHLRLSRQQGRLKVLLDDGPEEHFCRPAVDPLFRSAAEVCGAGVVGVVMTGMGSDGALGAAALRQRGAPVIVQDERTSTVWSMPRMVIEQGAACAVLPADRLGAEVARLSKLKMSPEIRS